MKNTAYNLVYHRWILYSIATFLCFFISISFLNYNQHSVRLWADISIGVTTTAAPKKSSDSHHYYYYSQSQDNVGAENRLPIKKCDIFDGRWIRDPKGHPLYQEPQCPFLGQQVSCRRNQRPDFDYAQWRWEAKDCEIPRFNGRDMLERLRGKRVTLVGDSLNRNQFESLSCLLYSVIPPSTAYVNVRSEFYKVFKAKDYNCTVEFYWNPFLVELDETDPSTGRLLKLDTLHSSASKWRGADILVFNTGHWWVHTGKMQAWDLYQYEGKVVENLELETAFDAAMKTWARWINQNVDPAKTTVFFRSVSPEHKGQHWCYNQTQPIEDESYVSTFSRLVINTVETTIAEMKTPVRYLNITKLSGYRKDAHPSVYLSKQGKMLTEEQRKQPRLFADCSHWCVPGVPDTWNSLLYASLVLETSPNSAV